VTPRPLEASLPDDPFLDYCLWPYQPLAPIEGKIRSINLLRNSFDVMGVSEGMHRVVDDLVAKLGPWLSVWGLKFQDGMVGWEYYFYDYERLDRYTSISRVLDIMSPHLHCPVVPQERRPYFMFSLDLDDDLVTGKRNLDEVHVYVGNVGSNVSSGICYTQTVDHLRMDNVYYFFNSETEMESIIGKIACSAHLDLPSDISPLYFQEMKDAKTIVVANKKNNEGIYYSRVTIDHLIFFLHELSYPKDLVAFVQKNRDRLDHMFYDVGLDYTTVDGKVTVLKSGYYGYF